MVKPLGVMSSSGTKQNRPAAADRLVSPTEESGLRCLVRYCRSLPLYLVHRDRFEVGGADEIRTRDLRRAKAALSQLSYGPSGVFC